jgi:hypothetical protein
MRKLRTCPVRGESTFGESPAGPLFQRACNMEVKDERSAADAGCSFLDSRVTGTLPGFTLHTP